VAVSWRTLLGLAQPAWQRLTDPEPAPPALPPSPSAAGRRLAQAGVEKRRTSRAENIRRHCASILASIPPKQEPAE
jgi:hypothetical protein